MNRGYIRIWRKIEDSAVFQSEGLLKVFIWCLIRANHKGGWVSVRTGKGVTEVRIEPGQFIFGRKSAANRLKMNPETVRKRIHKLEKLGICTTQSTTHYTIITIVEWHTYQGDMPSEVPPKVPPKYQPSTTNKNDKNDKEDISSEISLLREKYSDQNLIEQAFTAITSTRKSGRVADSVLLAQLQAWEKYPVAQVEAGIRTYLEKNCAAEGKGEKYLLGIIRNQNHVEPKQSTGSALLDAYYERHGA